MAIEHVITNLRQTLETISAGTVKQFEDELAPIHVEWHHARVFEDEPVGFLSFHHEVIQAHTTVLTRNGVSVQKPMRNPKPHYRKHIDSLTDPESFSQAIEDWHNSVHMNPIYPMDFMDPAKNIYMDLFWQFHTLIEDKFIVWLKKHNVKYDDVSHALV